MFTNEEQGENIFWNCEKQRRQWGKCLEWKLRIKTEKMKK